MYEKCFCGDLLIKQRPGRFWNPLSSLGQKLLKSMKNLEKSWKMFSCSDMYYEHNIFIQGQSVYQMVENGAKVLENSRIWKMIFC